MTVFDLFSPDAFEGNPVGFAVNQVLHFAIIGALPVWLGVPAWLVLILFAAWEVGQVWRAGGAVWDSLEDFGFVAAGALVVAYPHMAIVAAAFLLAGIAWRAGL